MDNNQAQKDVEISAYLAMHKELHTNYNKNEISLIELWRAVWSAKLFIISITFIFAVASVGFALSKSDVYKAQAVLTPATSDGGGSGLASLAGQFGGLASLAGINLGSGSVDKTGLALEILRSRKFLQAFIDKYDLTLPLMAAKGWNLSSNELTYDEDIYDVDTNQWVRQVRAPKSSKPSLWETYEELFNIMNVVQDNETGIVVISIEFYSPFLAKEWVDLLVMEINRTIKLQDQKEAEDSIVYLENQLKNTNVAAMQSVFYQLIEEQSKNMMLTQIKDEYALKTIDPAQVPEEKYKPSRALICILGTVLGGMLSVLLVIVRYFTRDNSPAKPNHVKAAQGSK